MDTFKFGGQDVPIVQIDDWLLTETRAVQRWLGDDFMESGTFMQTALVGAVSVARHISTWTISGVLDSMTNADVMAMVEEVAKRTAEASAESLEVVDEFASPTSAAEQPAAD
jgi:hypothetical protein